MATISGTVNGVAGGWVRVFGIDLDTLPHYAIGPDNLTLTQVLASSIFEEVDNVTGEWESTDAELGHTYLLMAYPIGTPINTTLTFYGDVTNPLEATEVRIMGDTTEDIDFNLISCTSFMSGTISNVTYDTPGSNKCAECSGPLNIVINVVVI